MPDLKAAMGAVKEINVELDQQTLGMLLRTFTYLRDHYDDPKVWDHSAQMIGPEEIVQLIDKMQPYTRSGGDPVTIPMNFFEWTTYTGLLHCTSNKIPQQDPKDYEVLDNLLVKYGEMDDAGLTPREP